MRSCRLPCHGSAPPPPPPDLLAALASSNPLKPWLPSSAHSPVCSTSNLIARLLKPPLRVLSPKAPTSSQNPALSQTPAVGPASCVLGLPYPPRCCCSIDVGRERERERETWGCCGRDSETGERHQEIVEEIDGRRAVLWKG
ncbi:hypothetical protein L7F22_012064 [Adiantum nelumboides]|nr:hypothetical protein [Adiantum nelumboides]